MAIILTLNDFRSVLGKENDGNVVQTLDKRGIAKAAAESSVSAPEFGASGFVQV